MNVKLLNDKVKLSKLSDFDTFRIFSEVLAAVNMTKTILYLNRPIYFRFTIFYLSKVLMYQFHYDYMKRKYGSTANVLFTDTDNICYEVKTEDVFEDILQDANLFDASEYGRDHPLYSTANKKAVGKMKDETHVIPIEEFVAWHSTKDVFNHAHGEQHTNREAKRVKKSLTKRQIRYASYKRYIFETKQSMASMNKIRCENHEIYSIKLNIRFN